jgi:hypothetical protein
MAESEKILEKLSLLEHLVANQCSIAPRWLSMKDACAYAGKKSRNWMQEKLLSGDIHGYQENNKGNWVIDKTSIDEYFLGLSASAKSKLLDLKKRTGLS